MRIREKTTAILLIAIFMISIMAFAVALPVEFPSEYGIWQPHPETGTVEWTMAQAHSGIHSAYLMAWYPSTPTDSNEVYVLPIPEIPKLNDLNSMSFWYYRPSGTVGGADIVPPQIDLWLDTTFDGNDDEWLLGQIVYASTYDVWVEVTLEDIEWIRATGGHIYGWGAAGLAAAKMEPEFLLGDANIGGFGVQCGSPATRDDERIEEQKYYIDDIEINGVVYDFENTEFVLEVDSFMYTILGTSTGPGSITPPQYTNVQYNQPKEFTMTPNAYCYVDELTIDGNPEAGAETYTFTLTDNDEVHTIHAEFAAYTLGISVDPLSFDFGSVPVGGTAETTVTVSNTGDTEVYVSADIADPFFKACLELDDTAYFFGWDLGSIAFAGSIPVDLDLTVLPAYAVGTYSGTLVFEITPPPP